MKKKWLLFAIGSALVLIGSGLAALIQTSGGVRIQDVRFDGAGGARMSALLYVPPNATAQTPAPGVLAVHGYMNSREMQGPFAIEFARRGYVVLALDQMGHGNSSPPAFANGFGGPDGLKYLRSLPFVDKNNIGMEGHSMGGWAVLAAAAAMPDGYKSLILNGSSTGKPFAADGTPTWPRNLALAYARYDEFAPFFWGAPDARKVNESKKLAAVFGLTGNIEPGKVYGSIEAGTARVLFQPSETHAQNHLSHETVGHAIDWFQRTLAGSKPLPATDQVWLWKEIGTLVALAGFIVLLLGTFQVVLRTRWFAGLAATVPVHQGVERTPRWWLAFALTTLIPAVTFFPLTGFGRAFMPATIWLPQEITNWIMAWALGNALLIFVLARFFRGGAVRFDVKIGPAVGIALATVAVGYVALLLVEAVFAVDFRYWVVTVQPMNGKQFVVFLIYLIPFTGYFLIALRALHSTLPLDGAVGARHYLVNAAALALGFGAFLAIEYGTLFATGALILPTGNPLEALITIIGIQFLVLLPLVGVISTFTYARTNSYVPGALICGLFVTWYIVASQATQAPI
jgi:pimeloyl-ACP methyl ester carboxylesterase